MKSRIIAYYRQWVKLSHQGVTEDGFDGLEKFDRAKSIGLVVAALPYTPLLISDISGFERGWLWYAWSVFAIAWAIGISLLILWNMGRSLTRYLRDWRGKRK